MLDLYVRDGFVYYNAVRQRSRQARSLSSRRSTAPAATAARERIARAAEGVLDQRLQRAGPAHGDRSLSDSRHGAAEFPAVSIRQIPGAFEKATHRVAGSRGQPRRHREGHPDAARRCARVSRARPRRLSAADGCAARRTTRRSSTRSSTPSPAEALTRDEVARDRHRRTTCVSVSPLFSWREAAFVASLADKARQHVQAAQPARARRAGADRAAPGRRREASSSRRTRFKMEFQTFDWRSTTSTHDARLAASRFDGDGWIYNWRARSQS